MRKIIVCLIFLFLGVDLTVSWGGPLAELSEPGEVRIRGIDYLANAVQSHARRFRRPHNVGLARQIPRPSRKASPNQKPSVVQMVSDKLQNKSTPQIETNHSINLMPYSPFQFVSADYFPTSPGITWTYVVNTATTSEVKVLAETANVRGVGTSIALNSKTGMVICYTSDSNGILIHRQLIRNINIQATNVVDLLVTFIPPIRLADGLVEIGQTSYSIGTAQYTLLPQRRVFDLAYTASYTLQAIERVTVPAGTLDTLIFHGTFAISGDLESETFYLTKGIGLIKDVVESNNHRNTMELSFTNAAQ